MTGFGRGHAPFGSGRVSVELRSVNHRYLDLRLRLASELSSGEEAIERRIRSSFSRGRLELSAKIEGGGGGTALNRELAKRYLKDLEELRLELGLTEPISLGVLAAVPEVFQPSLSSDVGELESALDEALRAAIESTLDMRGREGEALLRDFEARLTHIEVLLPQLMARAETVPVAAIERLRLRLARLLEATACPEVDESRLAQELALLAERCDITEELTRLGSHLAQFRKIAREKGSMGRRLEFLLQEMAREASTMGAKAQDAVLQHLVVDLRGELAKLREQIQNVE